MSRRPEPADAGTDPVPVAPEGTCWRTALATGGVAPDGARVAGGAVRLDADEARILEAVADD